MIEKNSNILDFMLEFFARGLRLQKLLLFGSII